VNASGLNKLCYALARALLEYGQDLDNSYQYTRTDRDFLYGKKLTQYLDTIREQFLNLTWAEKTEFYLGDHPTQPFGIYINEWVTQDEINCWESIRILTK
jgi:hypothetical protein